MKMATNTIAITAFLITALCAGAAICPMVMADGDNQSALITFGTEEVDDSSQTVNDEGQTDSNRPEPPQFNGERPEFDPENAPELTFQTITLDDGTTIEVPLLPDGTLPERSEDGTAPSAPGQMNGQMPQGMPGQMNGERPEFDPENAPELTFQTITLDDGTTIEVPLLPDGTLPERSEDGTAPSVPEQMNGQMPQGMPTMDNQNGQSFGPQMGGMGMPGQMNGQGAPSFDGQNGQSFGPQMN